MHPILNDDTYIEIIGNDHNYDYYIFKEDSYDSYIIDENMALELKNADGKKPLNIPKEDMTWLKEKKFIQTSRYVKGKEKNRFIVILIGSRANKFKKIAKRLANLLPMISSVILLLGVFAALSRGIPINSSSNNLFLFALLIMISVLFHEAGHLIVGISLGYYFSDLSILLCKCIPIPIGMCVCRKDVDSECDFNAKDEISFYMAGIEMELMLTGLFCFYLLFA